MTRNVSSCEAVIRRECKKLNLGQRVKVLQVTDALGGGVLSSVANICNHLDRGSFEIVLAYTPREEAPPAEILARLFRPDVKRILVPAKRKIDPAADWRTFCHYRRIMASERPQVVHLHSSKAGLLGRAAAFLSGIKRVFYSPRGFSFLRKDVSENQRRLFWSLEKLGSFFPGTIVTVSASEAEEALSLVPKSRIRLVENGIDLAAIDREVAGLPNRGLETGMVTIVTVGRTTPAKDPVRLLKIIDDLRRRTVISIKFLWIGGGALASDSSLEDKLRVEIRQRCLQDVVEVTGWIPRSEVWRRLFSEADIYLQVSLWEGMPMGVLEAFACGKPVVANKVIGNRDAVRHGVTGLLGDTDEDIIKALSRLVDDQVLRLQMAKAARYEAEARFSAVRVAQELNLLYTKSNG